MEQDMKTTMKTSTTSEKLGVNKKRYNPQDSSKVTNKDLDNTKKSPPLEGDQYQKIGWMWTLKHEIISPKFYELLPNIYSKGENDIALKNFYNNIKMILNEFKKN